MRCRCDQWFVIPENTFIVEVKVIITDVLYLIIFAKSIIKCCIQMIVYTANSDNIPGMAVFDTFIWVVAADCDHTPDSQFIKQYFNRLGDSLTDTNALSKRSYDFMGIGFLEFIVTDVFTDKVMHIFFLFPFGQLCSCPYKLVDPCGHCLLMFSDFIFFKKIFRNENNIR